MSNEEISQKLGVPFPGNAIKTRQGQAGRSFRYVEGHTVIHRLNEATGNNWSLEIKEITSVQIGSESRLQARVALTIPGLGTREHIGVQSVNDRGGEDLVKGVVTDALKKAATLFGVGLELYGPDYEAGEIAQPAHRQPPRDVSAFGYDMPPVVNAPQTRQDAPHGAERPKITNPSAPVSDKQIGFIKGLARQKGISDERLAARCSQLYNVAIDHLTKGDASDLIDRLQALPDPAPSADDTDTHNDSTQAAIDYAGFDARHPDLAAKHRQ